MSKYCKCRLVEMLPGNLQQLFVLQVFLHDYGLVVYFLFSFFFLLSFLFLGILSSVMEPPCTLLNGSTYFLL